MIGGGTTFGNLTEAELDLFDLDAVPVSLGFGIYQTPPTQPKLKAVNPAIRALVINHLGRRTADGACHELPDGSRRKGNDQAGGRRLYE